MIILIVWCSLVAAVFCVPPGLLQLNDVKSIDDVGNFGLTPVSSKWDTFKAAHSEYVVLVSSYYLKAHIFGTDRLIYSV